jgi:hypothetical protein
VKKQGLSGMTLSIPGQMAYSTAIDAGRERGVYHPALLLSTHERNAEKGVAAEAVSAHLADP